MKDDWHGEVFLIREVSLEKCLDRLCLTIDRASFVIGLCFVQSGQLDHAVCLTREIVEHNIKIGVVLLQNVQPRIKARIGGREFGEIAMIFPTVVAM